MSSQYERNYNLGCPLYHHDIIKTSRYNNNMMIINACLWCLCLLFLTLFRVSVVLLFLMLFLIWLKIVYFFLCYVRAWILLSVMYFSLDFCIGCFMIHLILSLWSFWWNSWIQGVLIFCILQTLFSLIQAFTLFFLINLYDWVNVH